MSITDWQMQLDIQNDLKRQYVDKQKKGNSMTTWIKNIDGVLPTPFTGTQCIIAQRDNDGVSLYTSHAMFDVVKHGDTMLKCFVLMDDGIGEIIPLDKVVAYTTYDTNELKGL